MVAGKKLKRMTFAQVSAMSVGHLISRALARTNTKDIEHHTGYSLDAIRAAKMLPKHIKQTLWVLGTE